NIGASGGAASLAIVAPGISEALVATAAGLAAAIPAVIFYNLFTHRVDLFTTEMEALSAEVLNIVGRNVAERVTASTENRI
ncbi:MAG: MotA/TolQ/ExbB proton channel family protein, partial [Nitrospirae bacterium]|nr:MotA/TolQ/ExbB proton channel family protein [Nitrospirota bacterium]